MTLAFAAGASLPTRATQRSSRAMQRTTRTPVCVASDVREVVDTYFPPYRRNRAPEIRFDGERGISVAMPPVQAFQEVDRNTPPLFDYSFDDFVPDKPVPPSDISWPSGDGRGNPCRGTKGSFSQPNLQTYGPFPDFFKRSCDQ